MMGHLGNDTGLSQRANHPPAQLHLLHGSLFDVKCTTFDCDYREENNYQDPIVPALAIPSKPPQSQSSSAPPTLSLLSSSSNPIIEKEMDPLNGQERGEKEEDDDDDVDISDDNIPLPLVNIRELPHCPKCKDGLLRPGVVWFGEMLPAGTISAVDRWIRESKTIDLMLVIGTSAKVYPAAGYVDRARAKGARVAVINIDPADASAGLDGLRKVDWFFCGDAGVVVPQILEAVIGETDRASD